MAVHHFMKKWSNLVLHWTCTTSYMYFMTFSYDEVLYTQTGIYFFVFVVRVISCGLSTLMCMST